VWIAEKLDLWMFGPVWGRACRWGRALMDGLGRMDRDGWTGIGMDDWLTACLI